MIQLAHREVQGMEPGDADGADLALARQGDLVACERLYRRHRTRAQNLARLMVGSQGDAEDVCQDAFVRAFSGLAGFRGEVPFAAWLCRIVVNRCHDLRARRRTRRELQLVDDAEEAPAPIAERAAPELRLAIKQALGRISDGQREVLICHDVLGMSHEEIGFVMDCAPGTCKAQLHKARLRLRELLGGGERP